MEEDERDKKGERDHAELPELLAKHGEGSCKVEDIIHGVDLLPECLDVGARKSKGRKRNGLEILGQANCLKECPEVTSLKIVKSKDS